MATDMANTAIDAHRTVFIAVGASDALALRSRADDRLRAHYSQ